MATSIGNDRSYCPLNVFVTHFYLYLEGNDVYGPKFNLGFGGRRTFCDTEYADLGERIFHLVFLEPELCK